MQILIDIPKHHYENIKSIDSVSLGRIPYKGIVMYSINAIKNGVVQEHKKGHWIYKEFDEKTGMTNVHICSKCGYPLASLYKSFCSVCGSDNREVEE